MQSPVRLECTPCTAASACSCYLCFACCTAAWQLCRLRCAQRARLPCPAAAQGVAHEVLALEVLIQMLEVPSEDSVEVAVEFTKEVGAYLKEVVPQGLHR